MSAAPANPAQVTDAMVKAALSWVCDDVLPAYDIPSDVPRNDPELPDSCRAALTAAIGAGGQAVAPAGWFNQPNDFHGYQQVAKEFEGSPGTIPLYTHPAPSGQAVAVKPLDWSDESWGWQAFPAIGEYRVEDQGLKWNVDRFWTSYRGELLGKFASRDEAQAAAQADYERRIMSALSRPHPADERVVEALTKPIDMQDVRLAVGEGKLTNIEVLNGVNAELRRRAALADGGHDEQR